MAHAYRLINARATGSSNPQTATVVTVVADTVVVLLLKVVGSAVRTGGPPILNGRSMTQANTSQIAAASPEASCELWYFLKPPVGSLALSIPNTGAATLFWTVCSGQAASGSKSAFDGANGGNSTSTNPTPGAVVTTHNGDIGFAITAGGWQTWAPSAQAGTIIANTDDGTDGGGEQYLLQSAAGSSTLSWTFGTSDDWGAVSAYFKEIPAELPRNYQAVRADSGMSVNVN